MTNLFAWLQGKKTYIIGCVSIIYALSALATGHIDQQTAVETILAALGGMSMRYAIEKK